jgi:hypothetical protein
MAQAPDRSPNPERFQSLPELPDWAPWVQAGVTALLAVLFLVMVGKMRDQNSTIRGLVERVQGLENSRALDKTSGLEQQVRSTVERLQAVERTTTALQSLGAQNKLLQSELRQLQTKPSKNNSDDFLQPLPPIKP